MQNLTGECQEGVQEDEAGVALNSWSTAKAIDSHSASVR